VNLAISSRAVRRAGFTLVEAIVAVALGTLVLAVVASITVYSSRTFSAISNYVDLDVHSRFALDIISREARQCTAVVDCQTNGSVTTITLTNMPAVSAMTLIYDSGVGTLTFRKSNQPDKVLLTSCDRWNVWLYTRAPTITATNIGFNAATNISACKLINMSWKCSRTIMGSKLNTESVQTAQIVLRNKVN
jgi:Prokaryotic N-terminal methylation motif